MDNLWRGCLLPRQADFGRIVVCSRSRVKQRRGGHAMSLFQCSECGCVEDTFLCHYWSARVRQTNAMCSACDPTVGKWHGEFPRESARNWIKDRRGFLVCDKGEIERWLGQPIEIIGHVT